MCIAISLITNIFLPEILSVFVSCWSPVIRCLNIYTASELTPSLLWSNFFTSNILCSEIFLLTWVSIFQSFIFNLHVSLYWKYISYMDIKLGPAFYLIWQFLSFNEIVRPFVFNAIINTIRSKSFFFLLVSFVLCFLCLSFLPFELTNFF